MRPARALIALTALVCAGGLLASCSTGASGGGNTRGIAVTASDTGCRVATTSLDAGTHTFDIRNTGTEVTEFYVFAPGDKVVGEVENIGPGVTRPLLVELSAGTYEAACKPGMTGDGIRSTLTVRGVAAPQRAADAAQLDAAAATYKRYVQAHSAELVRRTAEFVAAVKANDVRAAKALFPVARAPWERIEPVAESFVDLDAAIDARENGVEAGQAWTGFHRLEKALWVTGDVRRDGPVADKLLADVRHLVTRVNGITFTPLQMANGSKELLDEVATGKVTGEEDRYSHTDLWDFRANVEGAQAAIDALRPLLVRRDPALVTTLDARFATVHRLLATHARGAGFVAYTELRPAQVRALAAAVDGVAEPLSTVAATVAQR
jgi:iron uptake system component EfeO